MVSRHPVCFASPRWPLEGRLLNIYSNFFFGCAQQTPKPSCVSPDLLPLVLMVARNGLQKTYCGVAVRWPLALCCHYLCIWAGCGARPFWAFAVASSLFAAAAQARADQLGHSIGLRSATKESWGGHTGEEKAAAKGLSCFSVRTTVQLRRLFCCNEGGGVF